MGFLQGLKRHAPTLHSALRTAFTSRLELFPFRVIYANKDLHRGLKKILDFRDGVFFEVGAYDGIYQSNTAYLEKYLGWKGILVEAVPNLFLETLKNRPKAKCYHAALVPADFDGDYIEVHYARQMSLTRLSDNAVSEHVDASKPWLGQEGSAVGQVFFAPVCTAQEVIDRSGFNRIDFFSLDVEGAELSVLKGIDFARTKPRYFLIEAWEIEAIEAFLVPLGYKKLGKLGIRDYLFEAV